MEDAKKLTSALGALASYGIGKVKSENKPQTSEKPVQYWEEPGVLIKKSKNENGEEVKETILEGKLVNKEVTSKLPDSGYITFEYDAKGNLEYTEETDSCGSSISKYYDKKGQVISKTVKTESPNGDFTEYTYKDNKLTFSSVHTQTANGYEEFHYNGQGELLSKKIMTETNNGEVNEKIREYYQKDEHSQELKLSGKEIETNYPDGEKVYISEGYKAPYLDNYKTVTTKNKQGGETTLYYNNNELRSKTETNADRTNLKEETYDGNRFITETEECFEDGTGIRTEYGCDLAGRRVPRVLYTETPDGKTITEHFDINGQKEKDKTVRYKENDNTVSEKYDKNGNLKSKVITTKNGIKIREKYNEQGEVIAKQVS